MERRDYYLTADLSWMLYGEGWNMLNSLGMVLSTVTIGENPTQEHRFYISSLGDVKTFARAVRAHWGIENFPPLVSGNDIPRRLQLDQKGPHSRKHGCCPSYRAGYAQAASG